MHSLSTTEEFFSSRWLGLSCRRSDMWGILMDFLSPAAVVATGRAQTRQESLWSNDLWSLGDHFPINSFRPLLGRDAFMSVLICCFRFCSFGQRQSVIGWFPSLDFSSPSLPLSLSISTSHSESGLWCDVNHLTFWVYKWPLKGYNDTVNGRDVMNLLILLVGLFSATGRQDTINVRLKMA